MAYFTEVCGYHDNIKYNKSNISDLWNKYNLKTLNILWGKEQCISYATTKFLNQQEISPGPILEHKTVLHISIPLWGSVYLGIEGNHCSFGSHYILNKYS